MQTVRPLLKRGTILASGLLASSIAAGKHFATPGNPACYPDAHDVIIWTFSSAILYAAALVGLPLLERCVPSPGGPDDAPRSRWLQWFAVYGSLGAAGGHLRSWGVVGWLHCPPPPRELALLPWTFMGSVLLMALLEELHALAVRRRLAGQARLGTLAGERRRLQYDLMSEDDRRRKDVAEILHSEVQGRLVVAQTLLRRALGHGSTGSLAVRRVAGEVLEHVRRVRADSLARVTALTTAAEYGPALAQEIRRICQEFQAVLPIILAIEGSLEAKTDDRLPAETRTAIGRFVREALLNALKHAHPGRVEIRLETPPEGGIALTIRDDGRGFAPGGRSGFGLAAPAAHLETAGGSWSVESAPGQGTVLRLRLPVAAAGAAS